MDLLTRELLLGLDANLPAQRHIPAQALEIRADAPADGPLIFQGYACITGHGYEMYGGAPYGWTEMVMPGAFRKTLSESVDVQLLVNHGGLPLARTKSGTLTLSEDSIGEHVVAQLDRADPDVQRLEPKMRRGDLTEMSFAFRVVRQRWLDDQGEEADAMTGTVRQILEVDQSKGDVSIVNYGANDAAWGSLRSLDNALAELRAGHDLSPETATLVRAIAGSATPAPVPEPVAPVVCTVNVAALRRSFAR